MGWLVVNGQFMMLVYKVAWGLVGYGEFGCVDLLDSVYMIVVLL